MVRNSLNNDVVGAFQSISSSIDYRR